MMKIGVLALQGSFQEHIHMLASLDVETTQVRKADQLSDLDGLIIPGGESTTIGKLASTYGLIQPIQELGAHAPIWGTCAGAILLSKDARRAQPLLSLMDITVERNAFGRQVDSFEVDLSIEALEQPDLPFHAVFIRAPLIESAGDQVEILASLETAEAGKRIVAAREGTLLATSFHPELTDDSRFHRYFLDIVEGQKR